MCLWEKHRMKGEPLDDVVNQRRKSGFQAAAVEVRATRGGEEVG